MQLKECCSWPCRAGPFRAPGSGSSSIPGKASSLPSWSWGWCWDWPRGGLKGDSPMAEFAAAQPAPAPSLRELVKRHPLPSYFVIAYVGSWILGWLVVLSQRGLKVITIPDGLDLVLF